MMIVLFIFSTNLENQVSSSYIFRQKTRWNWASKLPKSATVWKRCEYNP